MGLLSNKKEKKDQIDKARDSRYRQFYGLVGMFISVIALAFSLYSICYLSGFFDFLKIFIDTPIHLALHLSFLLCLIFILVPPSKKLIQTKVPIYDIILIVLAVGWNLYLIIYYDAIYERSLIDSLNFYENIFCWVNLLIILEASRRLLGPIIPGIVIVFILYALFSDKFPGFLYAKGHSWDRVGHYIGLFVSGIYGNILNISATIVVSFILFAQFLFVTGGGDWFIKIAQAVLGHVRGGPAKVAIFCSALMGTLAGSGMANVATTGVFTIPLMKRTGYSPHFAGAVEAAASNGGQIMPPVMGIAAFIMVDFLDLPYSRIVAAAILPALFYFAALFLMVDLEAVKKQIKGIPRSELPSISKTLLEGWQFIIPLTLLMYLLVGLQYSPAYSALAATAVLIIIGLLNPHNRINFTSIYLALKNTALVMMMMAIILALAGVIIGCVQLTGLSYRLSMGLVNLAGNSHWMMLILTAITAIILGMGMTTTAVYIMLAVLIAPALVKIGFSPLAAHFFVFYFGVAALITPPVCPTSYVAAGIADAEPMRTGIAGAKLSFVGFVIPFLFVFRPALLMEGSWLEILFATFLGAALILGLTVALMGTFSKKMPFWLRAILCVASLLIMIPNDQTATFASLGVIAIIGSNVLLAKLEANRAITAH